MAIVLDTNPAHVKAINSESKDVSDIENTILHSTNTEFKLSIGKEEGKEKEVIHKFFDNPISSLITDHVFQEQIKYLEILVCEGKEVQLVTKQINKIWYVFPKLPQREALSHYLTHHIHSSGDESLICALSEPVLFNLVLIDPNLTKIIYQSLTNADSECCFTTAQKLTSFISFRISKNPEFSDKLFRQLALLKIDEKMHFCFKMTVEQIYLWHHHIPAVFEDIIKAKFCDSDKGEALVGFLFGAEGALSKKQIESLASIISENDVPLVHEKEVYHLLRRGAQRYFSSFDDETMSTKQVFDYALIMSTLIELKDRIYAESCLGDELNHLFNIVISNLIVAKELSEFVATVSNQIIDEEEMNIEDVNLLRMSSNICICLLEVPNVFENSVAKKSIINQLVDLTDELLFLPGRGYAEQIWSMIGKTALTVKGKPYTPKEKEINLDILVIEILELPTEHEKWLSVVKHQRMLTERQKVVLAVRLEQKTALYFIQDETLSVEAKAEIAFYHPDIIPTLISTPEFKTKEAVPFLAKLCVINPFFTDDFVARKLNRYVSVSWRGMVASYWEKAGFLLWHELKKLNFSNMDEYTLDQSVLALSHLCSNNNEYLVKDGIFQWALERDDREDILYFCMRHYPELITYKSVKKILEGDNDLVKCALLNLLGKKIFKYVTRPVKLGCSLYSPSLLLERPEVFDFNNNISRQYQLILSMAWRQFTKCDFIDPLHRYLLQKKNRDEALKYFRIWPHLVPNGDTTIVNLAHFNEIVSDESSWDKLDKNSIVFACKTYPNVARAVFTDDKYRQFLDLLDSDDIVNILHCHPQLFPREDSKRLHFIMEKVGYETIYCSKILSKELLQSFSNNKIKLTFAQIVKLIENADLDESNCAMILDLIERMQRFQLLNYEQNWLTLGLACDFVCCIMIDYYECADVLSNSSLIQLVNKHPLLINVLLKEGNKKVVSKLPSTTRFWVILLSKHIDSTKDIITLYRRTGPIHLVLAELVRSECFNPVLWQNIKDCILEDEIKFVELQLRAAGITGISELTKTIVKNEPPSIITAEAKRKHKFSHYEAEVFYEPVHHHQADFYHFGQYHITVDYPSLNQDGVCGGLCLHFLQFAAKKNNPMNYVMKQEHAYKWTMYPEKIHYLQIKCSDFIQNKTKLSVFTEKQFIPRLNRELFFSKLREKKELVLTSSNHAVVVVLHYPIESSKEDGHVPDLYFFDPNYGIWRWRAFSEKTNRLEIEFLILECLLRTGDGFGEIFCSEVIGLNDKIFRSKN
ncbi:hypothetical protein D5R81_02185 [Parashewanella spongiae]|uniref:Uncharacterized protein n=1 Tax=Parashewanella spongiae TaxID=342950 RepID=A0A3A6TSE0_9GAMM|nr:hypothetical protein [Parashewanella spongiae]MCL1079635.1 hypothetical protein [Parashewanella spongiae]RJY19074.1 hypothetical protein D5R81_02185 [Parashewanella spongiae]